MKLVGLVVLLSIGVNASNGARILGIFTINIKSHSLVINPILEGLIARGHQLDVITAFPLPQNTPNYTAIDFSPGHNFYADALQFLGVSSIIELSEISMWEIKQVYHYAGEIVTEYLLKHPEVQQLLHRKNPQYDLILVEQFYQDAFLMLGHQFQAPIVSISTFGWNSYFDTMMGSFGAWSHVPHDMLIFPDSMSFWQRLQNVYYSLSDKYFRYNDHLSRQQALANKYFKHLPGPLPSVEELSRSVSVILQNTYVPMKSIKPDVPGIVDVGGIHIKPVKPLPEYLKKFIDEAKHGVIYFSFGTMTTANEIPAAQMSAFVQVFTELSNIRIVWKRDSDNVEGLPENVLTRKWLPQNDILAHPNVKLFITHGGLLGSQEGVYHGVPMLGIPVHTDQHTNTARANLRGYGIKLNLRNVTIDSVRLAISELLHNTSYTQKIQENSRVFRERPETPLETAMYWIEYVIKFRGAHHLRSMGRDLTWYNYLLLDVAAVVLLFVLSIFILLWIVIKRLLGKCFCVKNSSVVKFNNKME